MRFPIAAILLVLILPALRVPAARAERPSSREARPNVILILSDDQGYGDYGFLGNPRIHTPHLDAMASRSAWLSTFYVTPVCRSTRAGVLTGRHHLRTGVTDSNRPLRAEEITLAEALRNAGYATGVFGKWHLGRHLPYRAQDQGFEEALTFRGGILRELEPAPVPVRYSSPMLEHNGKLGRHEGYATDVFFDAALDWIETVHRAGRPFFAFVATAAPHAPLTDAPDRELERYGDLAREEQALRVARAYAMITRIDANVGKLFQRLGELELLERTLVLYTNDNGPNGDEPARWNGGLTGIKGSIREGGVRAPLVAHWPGVLPAGRVDGPAGSHLDLFPTVLEACGVPYEGARLDGHSLLALLEGRAQDAPERMLVFQANARWDTQRNYAVRGPRWKLVRDHGFHLDRAGTAELYDLQADPLEREDLAAAHPERVEFLERSFRSWRSEMHSEGYRKPPDSAIALGDARESPLVLSHIPRLAEGTRSWMLRVTRPGAYRVQFRFRALKREGRAQLVFAERAQRGARGERHRREVIVPAGAGACAFPAVHLAPGLWTLEAQLSTDELLAGLEGVWQAQLDLDA